MLEREGRSGELKNIDVVYTRGAVQLVRLGRESPLGAGGEAGPGASRPGSTRAPLRGRSTRTRRGRSPGMDSRPGSPTIGTDAPAVYGVGGGVGEAAPSPGSSGPRGRRARRCLHDQPAEAKPGGGVKDEPDVKDIGLGARTADEESAG